MNFRTTYILFGVLIVLLIVFGLNTMFGTRPGQDTYVMSDIHAAKITADNIDRVEIDRTKPKEEKLVFVRDGKQWKLIEPYQARADSDTVNGLVRALIGAKKEEKADIRPDLSKFGLQSPAEVVTLKDGPEREWKLNVGNESVGGNNAVVYVTSSGQPKRPMAVKRSEVEGLFKTANDFRSKDLLTDSSDFGSVNRTTELALQEPKHTPVVLDKGAEERWRFEKPPFGEASVDPDVSAGTTSDTKQITGVRDLLTAVDGIRVDAASDFVANNVTDFTKYGLEPNKPGLLKIEVKRKPADEPAGEDKKALETRILLIGNKADDKGDKYYVRLESESNVVRVPAKSVEPVLKVVDDPSVLRNRDLVIADQFKIDAVDVKNPTGTVKLRKPANDWQLFEGGKERKADDQAVRDLLSALTAKRQIQSFPDPAREKEMGFDKPDAAVASIWEQGIQKDEKKDDKKPEDKIAEKAVTKDTKGKTGEQSAKSEPKLKEGKPTVKLTFGKKENGQVYVRRETAVGKTIAMVPESILPKVDQGPLAYLERTLPSFADTSDVTALVVQRNGATLEAQRQKQEKGAAATWKLTQPKDIAGRPADTMNVQNILRELKTLHAEKLISEHPSDAQLEQYGLKKPEVQVTVKVQGANDKKAEDWTYSFGKETEGKTGRYARENKSDLVFVVPSGVLSMLDSELQDPTVFHFDPSKVKELKLVGWKQATGFTSTLDVERKGPKSWTVKTPGDFDLDGDQVEAFLGDLANLKAMRFVHPANPKQQGLEPGERALQASITVEGEKAPLTLTIGARDAKQNGYFAQSSTLGDEVFLVPVSRFDRPLAGPKSFSKASTPAPKQ